MIIALCVVGWFVIGFLTNVLLIRVSRFRYDGSPSEFVFYAAGPFMIVPVIIELALRYNGRPFKSLASLANRLAGLDKKGKDE